MFSSLVPRRPASTVFETTCFSGGSETRKAAMRQGLRRIGAAQLERRRHAVGLGVAGIGRQLRRDLVGAADHRIEAGEGVVAVERGAELVFSADARHVEAAAAGDGEGASVTLNVSIA